MSDRVLTHRHVWIKDGPMPPASLALLVSEGWTVWRAVPSGYPPRSRYHFYDLVRDITDA